MLPTSQSFQVDARRSDGELVPVSLWMRQIGEGSGRRIALLEEVAVTTGEVILTN